MSDKYYSESETAALRSWVTWQMLRGAGWAALALLLLIASLLVIWGIGQLLPPQSKEAPSPFTAIEVRQDIDMA